jgi:hypothetical protein
MAQASRKHFGAGAQGKGDGTGGMSDLDPEEIPANIVLSNRDKAGHSEERGLDERPCRPSRARTTPPTA